MPDNLLPIEEFWKTIGLKHNNYLKKVILHSDEPHYLHACPGFGKTPVLLNVLST